MTDSEQNTHIENQHMDETMNDNQDTTENKKSYKSVPNLKFRSYKPYNAELKTLSVEPVDVLEDLQWVNEELRSIVEECKKSDTSLSNIVPKSIDWDLERDISLKMDVLKIRTQRSIAQLARKNATWDI